MKIKGDNMTQKTKKLIIGVSIICVIVGIVVTIIMMMQQSNPINIISNKLKLDLPSSVRVISFEYDKKDERVVTNKKHEGFKTKILIENKDINLVEKKLVDCFGKNATEIARTWANYKEQINTLLDLKNQKIKTPYILFMNDKTTPTSYPDEVWAFTCTDKNGQYYLYISY